MIDDIFVVILQTHPVKVLQAVSLEDVVSLGGKPGWTLNVLQHPTLQPRHVHVFCVGVRPTRGERALLSLSVMALLEGK